MARNGLGVAIAESRKLQKASFCGDKQLKSAVNIPNALLNNLGVGFGQEGNGKLGRR
jgi:hypothetical protein